MYIEEYCSVNKGLKRNKNEDNVYVNGFYLHDSNTNISNYEVKKVKLNKNKYYAIFDGIGGFDKGEYASSLCSRYMHSIVGKIPFNDILNYINSKILKIKEEEQIVMGSTATILKINKKEVEINIIGDSPVYVYSKGKITKYVEEDNSDNHIDNFIGQDVINPRRIKLKVNLGDKIIICSDGLSHEVGEAEIEYIIDSSYSSKYITDKLMNFALTNGGKDNISIIALVVKEDKNIYVAILTVAIFAFLLLMLFIM